MKKTTFLKTAKKVLFALITFFVLTDVSAATIISKGSGNWSSTATWVGGVVPSATDTVIIAAGHTVTLSNTTATTITCANLTVDAAATLSIGINSITATNIVLNGTIKSTAATPGRIYWGTTTSGGTFDGTGTIDNVSRLDTVGGTKTFLPTANITFAGTNQRIDIKTGSTVVNNGTVNIAGTGFTTTTTSTWTNNGTLNYGGTTSLMATGTLNAAAVGNVVNYTGVAQTAKVTVYDTLILSGSGTKTFATAPTVNGMLSMQGTATMAAPSVTYGPDAALQYNKPGAFTTGVEFPATFAGTGGVSVIGAGAITLGGAKTVTNTFSLATGSSVNLGAFTHTVGSVLLGGVAVTQATAGSSSSVALQIDDVFFAPSVGSFNVTSVAMLKVDTNVFDKNNVWASAANGMIQVSSNAEPIETVRVFDMQGRLLVEKSKINSSETSIESSRFGNQILIIQIISENQTVISKKVRN